MSEYDACPSRCGRNDPCPNPWHDRKHAEKGTCCCESSPPEFGGNLPDRDCPQHGERLVSDPCIAPPGNLCLDTGCWDMDRCVVRPEVGDQP